VPGIVEGEPTHLPGQRVLRALLRRVERRGGREASRLRSTPVVTDGRTDLLVPEGAALGVVVLHPHPDFGGDRWNPVVDALFSAVTGAGWAAVRFDFSSSDRTVAVAEATEAIDRLPEGLPVVMAGYSFGAGIATQVLDRRITSWVLVAPPFPILGFGVGEIAADPRPKLVLSPASDQYCPPADALAAIEGWAATTFEPIEGADHFLAGATGRVAARAVEFIRPG
jgi:alpha/beta superfamily hydrolase